MTLPAWALALPWTIIREKAAEYRLDPNLVAAIVQRESAGVRCRTRLEQGWHDFVNPRDWAEKLLITVETETIQQQMSWGLMQVMGAVARQHGFQGNLPELCDPEVGIEYGVRHLHWLSPRCATESDLICAYNHGHPEKTSGGMYVNQVYVDAVDGFLRELRALK